jgi:hypothetical protein
MNGEIDFSESFKQRMATRRIKRRGTANSCWKFNYQRRSSLDESLEILWL